MGGLITGGTYMWGSLSLGGRICGGPYNWGTYMWAAYNWGDVYLRGL